MLNPVVFHPYDAVTAYSPSPKSLCEVSTSDGITIDVIKTGQSSKSACITYAGKYLVPSGMPAQQAKQPVGSYTLVVVPALRTPIPAEWGINIIDMGLGNLSLGAPVPAEGGVNVIDMRLGSVSLGAPFPAKGGVNIIDMCLRGSLFGNSPLYSCRIRLWGW